MTYYQDSVIIDQLRHGHSFRRMSQQRTVHDLRDHAKKNLAKWWEEKWDTTMFRYLCGDTTVNHAGNAGAAPDTNHYIMSGDVAKTGTIATDEASIGNNDQMTLEDLDYAKELAKTMQSQSTPCPPIEPVSVDGGDYYVAVLHPYSVTDIRLNLAGSTKISFKEIMEYAHVRGLKNPLFTGALGIYNGIVLYESNYIYSPRSNVRRNLLLGRQAGVFALGNAYKFDDEQASYGKLYFSWFEEKDDYGNERGVAAGSVFGMKSCRFNSMDFGKIVISSYSAAHSS